MTCRVKQSVTAIAVALQLGSQAFAADVLLADAAGINTLVQFDLAPKPLSDALLEFTDVTGLGLVFDSRLVSAKIAPAIVGQYSAKVALDLLLADSGLRVIDVGGNTLAIVPVPREARAAEAVEASAEVAGETPADFSFNAIPVVDELLIVGTRTANPPYYKFKPTVTVGGDEVTFGGTVNVSDHLFQLPSMLSDITSANTTIFGTPAGLNMADLRGLGPERTLVLVNGRRFIPTFGGSLTLFGVDLNSIPASLVERIEVINGGATTSYGGDAVSGVVNFTLQDDIEGWRGAVQGGVTGEGDREEILATLTFGKKFSEGRGSVIASLTYDDQAGLFMSDREITSNPSGFAENGRVSFEEGAVFTRGFGGSSFSPAGFFQSVLDADGNQIALDERYDFLPDGSAIEPYEGRQDQLYNFASGHSLLTPLNRVFATLNMTYDIAPGHRLFFENSLANTDVVSQLAPIPLALGSGLNPDGNIVAVPLTNPFIPDDVFALLDAQGIENAAGLVYSRRIEELGPRRTAIQRRTFRSLIGFQGMFAPDWSYDVYYQFGRNEVNEERDGLLDISNYAIALDPARCADTAGCSLFNPFGSGHLTEDQLDFIRAPVAKRRIRTSQNILSAVISGPIDSFTDEAARVNLGLEFRREALDDKPDPSLDSRPVSGSLVFPGSKGSYSALEAFADLTMPIVEDKELLEELTVTAGMRLSNFSTTGALANWHLGTFWEPLPGLRVRLSYQSGRRAPNIAELFAGGPSGFDSFEDPCADITQFDRSTTAANCQSNGPLGVPDGFSQTQSAVDIQSFGNPNLKSEKSSNITWGLSFDTLDALEDTLGRLRLSVDVYEIRVQDYIVDLDANQLLAVCYESAGFDNLFCGENPVTGEPYIQRDPVSGNLVAVSGTIINAGQFWLKGYDVELLYTVDTQGGALPIDNLSVTALYTRNLDARQQTSEDGPIEELKGLAKYPKHRFQAGLSFNRGRFSFDWDMRFRGKAVSNKSFSSLEDVQIPSVIYNDVAARYRINDGITVYGGVRNLFDEGAPRVFLGSVQDTFPEFYDTLGRRFYLGAVFDF